MTKYETFETPLSPISVISLGFIMNFVSMAQIGADERVTPRCNYILTREREFLSEGSGVRRVVDPIVLVVGIVIGVLIPFCPARGD